MTFISALTAFVGLAWAAQAAKRPQSTYINAPSADRPVMPTYFSPNEIGSLTDSQVLKNYVDYIQWSSWGGEQAIGNGQLALLDEAGSTTPVTVYLEQPQRCAGKRIYTRYSLQLPEGAPTPQGWPKGQSGTFPCGQVRVSGYAADDGVLCFDGIHDPSAGDPDYTYPARWRPGLPKLAKYPEVDFCWPQWTNWGKRRATGRIGFAVISGSQPHSGGEWPVKLEFRNPFWCPRASGEGTITYRTLKATFYGKGLRFRGAVSEDELLRRRLRLSKQIGKPGVKRRVYRQHITPALKDCQEPFGLLRPPKITRE